MWRYLALIAFCASAPSVLSQDDVVQLRVLGGPQDDRGHRITVMQDGGILLTGTTNSTTDDTNHAWVIRMDSNAQVLWSTTIEDAPLLQALDAVEHDDGSMTVMGMRYASAADGYDWGWYRLNADGTVGSATSWGTSSWDLPTRCLKRQDSLWTIGTTYDSGNGDVQWVRHDWTGEAWSFTDSGLMGESPIEEVTADALFRQDTLVVAATLSPGAGGQAQMTAWQPSSEAVLWQYTSSFPFPTEAVAMDASDAGVLLLMNVEIEEGDRLAFTHLDWDGNVLLEHIPGSGFDIQGRGIQWYSPTDFATAARSDQLGSGGGEVLFSRWSSSGGVWQGGPSFGTPWDENVEHLKRDASGRMWLLGSTDGYSNGRDDYYLLGLPNADVGGYVTEGEPAVSDSALVVPFEVEFTDWVIAPNPARDIAQLQGAGPQDAWELFDSMGRLVKQGVGPLLEVQGLPAGRYWLSMALSGRVGILPLQIQH